MPCSRTTVHRLVGAILLFFAAGARHSVLEAQTSTLTNAVPAASQLRQEIFSKGATELVQRLNHSPGDKNGENGWNRLIRCISLGRSDYIALAPDLARGTDAGTSEDIGIALAYALPIAPTDVLGVVALNNDPTLGVKRICGIPFIEDSVKDLPGYVRKSRLAVGNVTLSRLASSKTACLRELAESSKLLNPSQK